MNSTQFNEKYKDFLEEGHYGLAIENESVIEYLDKRFEDEFTKIPGFKYSQIKMKFSMVRFYAEEVDTFEVERDIMKIMDNSRKIDQFSK